jgi:hypothetical protein
MRKLAPTMFGVIALTLSAPNSVLAVPMTSGMSATATAAAEDQLTTPIYYRRYGGYRHYGYYGGYRRYGYYGGYRRYGYYGYGYPYYARYSYPYYASYYPYYSSYYPYYASYGYPYYGYGYRW